MWPRVIYKQLCCIIWAVCIFVSSPAQALKEPIEWPAFDYVEYTAPTSIHFVGQIPFTECRVGHPGGSHFRILECGYLSVPEDYDDPTGRSITLFIGRLKATGNKPKADAFVPIAGGPGAAASESYLFPGQGFDKILQSRDIYIIDQRGTGKSGKLSCLDGEDEGLKLGAEDAAFYKQLVKQCLAELKTDPTQYTTSVAVRDLEGIRNALGLGQWNLYGGSYGTRVVQHYLRMYPQATRAVILDAVVYPALNLGFDIAINSQRALDNMIARCNAQQSCASAFPDLAESINELLKRLRAKPIGVSVEDISTGEPMQYEFKEQDLLALIRMSLYTPEVTAILPLLLHEAYAKNNYAAMARTAIRTKKKLASLISTGMHNTVMCSEDIAYVDESMIDREQLASTYIGEHIMDAILNVCAEWPKGPVDEGFKTAVASSVPALLLSGSADPITPPEYADKAASKLKNSLHLVAEGMGHGLASKGCVPSLMQSFIDAGDIQAIDASCLKRLQPAPFFIDFNGPTP